MLSSKSENPKTHDTMEEEARPSKKARGGAGSRLTAFALRLAKRLAVGDADGGDQNQQNLVFSPVSI